MSVSCVCATVSYRGHSAATSASGELFVWGRTHDVSNTLRYTDDARLCLSLQQPQHTARARVSTHMPTVCRVCTGAPCRCRFIWLQGMFPRLVAFMNRVSGGSMLASLEPAVNPFPGSDDVRFVKAACSVGAITVGITGERSVCLPQSSLCGNTSLAATCVFCCRTAQTRGMCTQWEATHLASVVWATPRTMCGIGSV